MMRAKLADSLGVVVYPSDGPRGTGGPETPPGIVASQSQLTKLMVHRPRRLVLVHIPKTGGTAIKAWGRANILRISSTGAAALKGHKEKDTFTGYLRTSHRGMCMHLQPLALGPTRATPGSTSAGGRFNLVLCRTTMLSPGVGSPSAAPLA